MKVYLNNKDVNAEGIYSFETHKLFVLSGSTILIRGENTHPNYSWTNLLNELYNNGIIVDEVFVKDYEFESPSAASSIILGRQSNGTTEFKNEDGVTIKAINFRLRFFEYINDNLHSKKIQEYIDLCNKTVARVQKMYPIDSIENLPIEKWDKRGSKETLTYLIEFGTNEMLSGNLSSNKNKLIYHNKNLEYEAATVTMNSNEGNTVKEKYSNFIKSIYDSIVRYNDEDYLKNKDKYSLVGANVLFTKLLSFYKPGSILLMASPTYFIRIFDHLELEGYNRDSIESNIILKRFIYNNLNSEENIYAISK